MEETSKQKAYSEVYAILDIMGEEYRKKIPKKLMEYIRRQKSDKYKVSYNQHTPIYEQNISKRALAIIAILDMKYWCENEQENYTLIEDQSISEKELNSLIELPQENEILDPKMKKRYERERLGNLLEKTYLGYGKALKGEIGGVDEADQYDGIIQMATLVLLSNRVSKMYKKERDERKGRLSRKEILKYNREIGHAYAVKAHTLSDLIASLYVLEKTSEGYYRDFFNYGKKKDNNDKDMFIIDVPGIGQMCVHFENEEGMQKILDESINKVGAILERKEKEKEISSEKAIELVEEMDEKLLPNYVGALHECRGGLPVEYAGNKIMDMQKKIRYRKHFARRFNS